MTLREVFYSYSRLISKEVKSLENIDDLWASALKHIEEKISKPSFDTWLKNTKAKSLQENTLTITAPNEFAKDWLQERYTQLIRDRKSTRLNSSHVAISYAVFCLKKKKKK